MTIAGKSFGQSFKKKNIFCRYPKLMDKALQAAVVSMANRQCGSDSKMEEERGSPLEVLQSPVSECQYFQLNYATFRRDQIKKGREEREGGKGGRKGRRGKGGGEQGMIKSLLP